MVSRRVILHLVFVLVLAIAAGDRALAAQTDGIPNQGLMAKVGSDLAGLFSEYKTHLAPDKAQELVASSRFAALRGSWVLVDAVTSGDAGVLQAEPKALGLRNSARFRSIISGEYPIDAIGKMTTLDGLKYAVPSYYATSSNDVARSLPHTKISRVSQTYGSLPMSFEANQGQTDPQVKFLSRGRGYTLFLTDDEMVLSLPKPDRHEYLASEDGSFTGEHWIIDQPTTIDTVRMRLVGADPTPEIEGVDVLAGKTNYFIGNDPAKWLTNISSYARVRYLDVYPGVDLIYYGNQGQLEYDFVVAPGADPGVIELEFEGADNLVLDDEGNLILDTPSGEVIQRAPMIYQEVNGTEHIVSGHYTLRPVSSEEAQSGTKYQVGFQVFDYDTNRTLIIDPTLSYSTYLIGDPGFGMAIAVDTGGNAYVTGRASLPTDFATAQLRSPSVRLPIPTPAYVIKLNPEGSAPVYSTFFGGSGFDLSVGIDVDADGNAYVSGQTTSTDFPTVNPLQPEFGGGGKIAGDAFVAKINAAGDALVYSTFLGGKDDDSAWGIAIDANDNAYVVGSTDSFDFPTTDGAFRTWGGENGDSFVTKINAAGDAMVYSTFLGGRGSDAGTAIAVDASGHAYVTGDSDSFDFPLSEVGFQLELGGKTLADVFVTKLDSEGSALVYSTFLGGRSEDKGEGIAVDSHGNAYVTGSTCSPNFPTTAEAFDTRLDGGCDAFVTRLNTMGDALVYSTYLGGDRFDGAGAIALDSFGNAWVMGETFSPKFPTVNHLQARLGGELLGLTDSDVFVAQLSARGGGLAFSTYFGGSGNETEVPVGGIAVDTEGNAYVAGSTPSEDFPTTEGTFQDQPGGGNPDAFVAKITLSADLSITKRTASVTEPLDPLTMRPSIKYTIIITNNGPDASAVVLKNTLPAGVAFVSATSTQGKTSTAPQGSCFEEAGVVTCDLVVLAKGASAKVTIIATATVGGTLIDTVFVSGGNDPDTTNNTAAIKASVELTPASTPTAPPTPTQAPTIISTPIIINTATSAAATPTIEPTIRSTIISTATPAATATIVPTLRSTVISTATPEATATIVPLTFTPTATAKPTVMLTPTNTATFRVTPMAPSTPIDTPVGTATVPSLVLAPATPPPAPETLSTPTAASGGACSGPIPGTTTMDFGWLLLGLVWPGLVLARLRRHPWRRR